MSDSAAPPRGPGPRSSRRRARLLLPRLTVGAVVAIPVLGVGVPALAQGLGVQSARLGGGTTAVPSCGALSAAVVSYRVTDGIVTAVSVTTLPAACNGADLSLTLVNGSTVVGSAGPLTINAGSVTAPVNSGPVSTTVTDVHLSVVG